MATPTPSSPSAATPAPSSAMAAMAAAVFSSPASPAAKAAALQLPRKGRPSAFNDAALLRIFAEKDPLNAPHGTKGAVWDDIGVALAREPGEERVWSGPACRTRIFSLLDAYDVHRAGRKTPAMIRTLGPNALRVLERTLNQVAKRTGGESSLDGAEVRAAPVVVPSPLKQTASMAVATEAKAPQQQQQQSDVASTKTTVVAKRRRRKGVKTKEQKRATAAMFEVMRHSREAYLNQLRVETAAQAAAKETGNAPAKAPTAKHSADVDLSVLRAVVKFSPFEAVEPSAVKLQWQAVSDQVFRHCGLRFSHTAIRDRCDALLEDFETNERKASTYVSGVAVADEELLKLLRMLHKAHKKRRRLSVDKASHGASDAAAVQLSAIEIDDEGNSVEELEQEQEQIIDETEEDEEESKPESLPVSRKRPRRESTGGASPDADPAAGMEFELENDEANTNSQDSTESHDYTPRKYKQRRPANELIEADAEPAPSGSGQLSAVLDAMEAERRERRLEFRAMLDLMKTQMDDSRTKWEREYAQRTREHDARQRESSALMEMLHRERDDRKNEVAALMATITKERDDRRNEFMVMMNLITKMIDSKPAQTANATAK